MSNFDELFQTYQGYKFIDGDKPLKDLEKYIGNEKDEWKTDDLALVHLTNYFPNKKIVSNFDGGKVYNGYTLIDNKKYDFSVPQYRNTVHFTLNGPVESHPYGSWDNMNYAVIEPLKYHISDVINLSTVDTYFDKTVDLSKDAVILIRKSIFDNIDKKLLDGKNIIVFSGNQNNVVNEILLYLGYNPQKIGMHNWVYDPMYVNKGHSILNFQEKQHMINPKLTFDMHAGSKHDIIAKGQFKISSYLSIIKKSEFVSLKSDYKITLQELKNVYKLYLKTNKSEEDSIVSFKNFIKQFHINVNDNKEIFIDSADKWYSDNPKNSIIDKNMVETLYNNIKQIENEEIEHDRQIKEQKIQKFKNSIEERMLNMTCEQAVKLCHKFPNYKTQFIRMFNSLLRITFSLENIGRPEENIISYSYLMKYISVRIDDDNFFYYLSDISEFKNHYDDCLRMEVDLSNMKISEIREILFKYQQYIYEQANKYISNENIKDSAKKMGYIKISYIVILLSIFLIIVFTILLVLLFQ